MYYTDESEDGGYRGWWIALLLRQPTRTTSSPISAASPVDVIDSNQTVQTSLQTTPQPIEREKRVPVENKHDHTRVLHSIVSSLQYSGTMAA